MHGCDKTCENKAHSLMGALMITNLMNADNVIKTSEYSTTNFKTGDPDPFHKYLKLTLDENCAKNPGVGIPTIAYDLNNQLELVNLGIGVQDNSMPMNYAAYGLIAQKYRKAIVDGGIAGNKFIRMPIDLAMYDNITGFTGKAKIVELIFRAKLESEHPN